MPPGDPAVRAELEADAAARGSEALHAELMEEDPAAAAKIYPQDARRVVRAWEVLRVSGRRFSSFHAEAVRPPADRPELCVWLDPPRTVRRDRVRRRADRMLAEGLVEEVRGLLGAPGGLGATARQGLGYKEICTHLEDGAPLAACAETLKVRTSRFAKAAMHVLPRAAGVRPRAADGATRRRRGSRL